MRGWTIYCFLCKLTMDNIKTAHRWIRCFLVNIVQAILTSIGLVPLLYLKSYDVLSVCSRNRP